jgi:radical SAM superfamily enzyme YgiQ (UPF0313 family)
MNKVKILLLFPPDLESMKRKSIVFHYGIASIASFLKQKGVDVKVYCSDDYSLAKIEEIIKEGEFNIVGISCDSANRINCFKIARLIKSIKKNTHIVLGGIHATFFHKKILENIASIDFVVRGEGEITFFELISKIENNEYFSNILGLSYKNNEGIIVNPPRPLIENLDDLPFILYELFDMDKAKIFLFEPWSVQMSRGCPFNCKFCADIGLWKRHFRIKSVERVIEELKLLKDKYGVNRFSFCDIMPTYNREWLKRICRYMIDNNTEMNWTCFSKAEIISSQILELMKKAGCYCIFYGIESFSNKMLRIMNKGYKAKAAIDTLNLTNKIGIKARFKLLFGFPGETKETLRKNLLTFKKLDKGVKCCGINIFEPHPGSPIYYNLEKHKLINDSVWFTNFRMRNFIKLHYAKSLLDSIYNTKKLISNLTEQYELNEGNRYPIYSYG